MAAKIEHHSFYYSVGEVMRHLRKQSGVPKQKIATAMGVSISKYISMEEGLDDVSLYDIYFFANAIDVAFGDVLGQIAACAAGGH